MRWGLQSPYPFLHLSLPFGPYSSINCSFASMFFHVLTFLFCFWNDNHVIECFSSPAWLSAIIKGDKSYKLLISIQLLTTFGLRSPSWRVSVDDFYVVASWSLLLALILYMCFIWPMKHFVHLNQHLKLDDFRFTLKVKNQWIALILLCPWSKSELGSKLFSIGTVTIPGSLLGEIFLASWVLHFTT